MSVRESPRVGLTPGLALWRNPILLKEMRTRMRSGRSFVSVVAHLVMLLVVLALVYLLFYSALGYEPQTRLVFSRALFGVMVWAEILTITFTAPALTAGALSVERERQTLDLLRVTLLSPQALLWGKFLSALTFLGLLIFSALPMQIVTFLLGGISAVEIGIAVLLLLVTIVVFCAMGILLSTFASRTVVATMLSYALALFVVVGLPLLLVAILFVAGVRSPSLSLRAQSILYFLGWLLVALSPGTALVALEASLLSHQDFASVTLALSNGTELRFPAPWIIFIGVHLVLGLVMLVLSFWRVAILER